MDEGGRGGDKYKRKGKTRASGEGSAQPFLGRESTRHKMRKDTLILQCLCMHCVYDDTLCVRECIGERERLAAEMQVKQAAGKQWQILAAHCQI